MPNAAAAFSVPERDWVEPPDDVCPQCRERLALYREDGEILCAYCGYLKEGKDG